jgi:hypothetical protein
MPAKAGIQGLRTDIAHATPPRFRGDDEEKRRFNQD